MKPKSQSPPVSSRINVIIRGARRRWVIVPYGLSSKIEMNQQAYGFTVRIRVASVGSDALNY